jgi:hypothetical protein
MIELPLLPPLEVKTKKLFDRGHAETGPNGLQHIEKWDHLEMDLAVWDHPWKVLHCADCDKEIKKLHVYARSIFESPRCIDCIELPAVPIQAWKMQFKMKRKSKKHPSGILKLYRVQTPYALAVYRDEVDKIYPLVSSDHFWSKP